jgi:capsular polysaccharide biosynthesis protein
MSSSKKPDCELPPAVSLRTLPVNFDERDRELFVHELEKTIPATRLLELRQVRISPEGILFKSGRVLRESFAFPFLFDEWKKRTVAKFLAKNYLTRKTSRLQQEAVWIVDEWSTGYFHWLTDALSRLYVMEKFLNDRVLLLPHHYERLKFVQPSLKPFAVEAVKFLEPERVLYCDKLIFPTPVAPSGHYREEIIRGVREKLVAYFGAPGRSSPSGRIYISRHRAPKRKIANEAEIVEVLRKFHFDVIHAEDLSFADQVGISSQARCLISNHGAGLTNMLFMNPGTNVLELRHQTDRVNNCYFTLSSALDLNYFYQTCRAAHTEEDAHTADLLVDPAEFENNLRLITGE